MTNGNLETRVAALEAQMQEIRELLQQTVQLQNQMQRQLNQQGFNLDRIEQIAESNGRAIEALTNHTAEARDAAEQERSELRVMIRDLIRASQQNVIDHELFRRRFEAIDPLIDDSSQD